MLNANFLVNCIFRFSSIERKTRKNSVDFGCSNSKYPSSMEAASVEVLLLVLRTSNARVASSKSLRVDRMKLGMNRVGMAMFLF